MLNGTTQSRQVCTSSINLSTHLTIIIDSGASVSLVNDVTLPRDLLQLRHVFISGIGGQELSSNQVGQWGPFGPALFVDGLSRNIIFVGVLSSFYPVSFKSRPATSSTEAVKGFYKIQLEKNLDITFLSNEECLYSFQCPRSLLNYQADSSLHRSHVLEARRNSRFQLANPNDKNSHEHVHYLCLSNLHDLSDRPLDRNTHVVSIPSLLNGLCAQKSVTLSMAR